MSVPQLPLHQAARPHQRLVLHLLQPPQLAAAISLELQQHLHQLRLLVQPHPVQIHQALQLQPRHHRTNKGSNWAL